MSWLVGWEHRKQINITGSVGAGTDYQIKLIVGESSGSGVVDFHVENHSLSFPSDKNVSGDLRFTDNDGNTVLKFWVEKVEGVTPNRKAVIWVKISDDLGSNQYIYCYYRKSSPSNVSNGEQTFVLFDDFEGGSLDTGKWDLSGVVSVGSSEVTLNNDDTILSKNKYGFSHSFHCRAKADEQDTAFLDVRDTLSNHDENLRIANSDITFPNDFDKYFLVTFKNSVEHNYYEDNWEDFRNTYYNYCIRRIANNKVVFEQENHSSIYADSNYISTQDLGIGMWVWDSTQESTLICDWCFIKKCIDSEPAYGSSGNEQCRKTITSDAKIKVLDNQKTISSDAKIVNRIQKTISSDAKIKKIDNQKIITSDAVIKHTIQKIITSNAFIKYFKNFYGQCKVKCGSEKDFYIQLKVNQPLPINPTNLNCQDLQTGEAIKLTWDGSNYGWNVYKWDGVDWISQNLTLIKGNEYVVGNLVSGVSYDFKIKGVNGEGILSTGTDVLGCIPTWDIEHYTSPIFEIKIDGNPQSDAILENVELAYGSSFSTARFYIPKKPGTAGLLDVDKQLVEVYINNHLVFTGYLVRKTGIIQANNQRVNYLAISKLWEYTWDTIGENINTPKGDEDLPIAINKAMEEADVPLLFGVGGDNEIYGEIACADMTKLEFIESMIRYAGNYRIYVSPDGIVSLYQIDNYHNSRNFEIGKHILSYNITKDITDKIKKVTAYSDNVLKDEGAYVTIHKYDYRVRFPDAVGDGQTYINVYIKANNEHSVLSDIEIYAGVNEKPRVIKYLEGIPAILPGHVGLDEWEDGSTNGKFAVLEYEDYSPEWVSATTHIKYNKYGDVAESHIQPSPMVYKTKIKKYKAKFIVLDASGNPKEEEYDVWLMEKPEELLSSINVKYECQLKDSKLSKKKEDVGYLNRTLHTGVIPKDTKKENNISDINEYLQERADSEFNRMQHNENGGSITVLGDEMLDLRTKIFINGKSMEVERIVHDFSSGFMTRLDLTIEQFYKGESQIRRGKTAETKKVTKKNQAITHKLKYDKNKYENLIGLLGQGKAKLKESGTAHLTD